MEGNKVKVKIINIKKEKNYLKNSLATMILFMSSQVLQFILVLDVLRETGSALIFSVAVAASSIFNIVFSPISGFINEKYDKRYIMGISSVAVGFLGIIIYFLYSSMEITSIIVPVVLLVGLGIFEVFYLGGCIPILSEIFEDKDMIEISATSTQMMVLIMKILSPLIGGIIYSIWSIERTIVFISVTFITTSCFCFSMTIRPKENKLTDKVSFLEIYRNKLGDLRSQKQLAPLLLILIVSSMVFLSNKDVIMIYSFDQIDLSSSVMIGLSMTIITVIEGIFSFIALGIYQEKNDVFVLRISSLLISGFFLLFFIILMFYESYLNNFFVIYSLFTAITAIFTIISMKHFLAQFPEEEKVQAISTINYLSNIFVSLGYIIYGFLIQTIGLISVVSLSGLLFLTVVSPILIAWKKSSIE
ncbi:MFS transporter [Enterococcus lactis]|uniref:MFS transporter n=2 Tax=Enterococcus TaxID=1350 RepID=A0AAW4QGJ7_9ENTE|nr:MFS transporter [Enterococcus lactis]MBX4193380.1 MFS transporter [Enterococcus lactis]MBX4228355.1 MFS transporter [Enterococcus lactis]